MNGSVDSFDAKDSRPSAFGLGRRKRITSAMQKKTHRKALPQVPAGSGRSLFRRVGTLGAQAHRWGGLGTPEAATPQASHLSPAQGDGTVPRVLRCPRRLSLWYLPSPETAARTLRCLPATPGLLPAQTLVRHLGQPAQRSQSPAPPQLAPETPHQTRLHAHRGFLAQPHRGALRHPEEIHPREYRRPRSRGPSPPDLPLPPLPAQETR